MDLKIILSGEEWDRVLDILGDQPFKKTSMLIGKIIEQARAQQQPPPGEVGQPRLRLAEED